jgi:hypothetical protein
MLLRQLFVAVLLTVFVAGCTPAAQTRATPAPAESLVVGDIPDTQAFITYSSPSGYQIDVPEAWSRSARGNAVAFTDKYDGERIEVRADAGGPSHATQARAFDWIRSVAHAVRNLHARSQTFSGHPVLRVDFTSDSTLNTVTGRSIRLDDSAYFFVRGDKQAMLLLSAPVGSDNVDQWKRIATSFRWR